jgi:hypothetical protein
MTITESTAIAEFGVMPRTVGLNKQAHTPTHRLRNGPHYGRMNMIDEILELNYGLELTGDELEAISGGDASSPVKSGIQALARDILMNATLHDKDAYAAIGCPR